MHKVVFPSAVVVCPNQLQSARVACCLPTPVMIAGLPSMDEVVDPIALQALSVLHHEG